MTDESIPQEVLDQFDIAYTQDEVGAGVAVRDKTLNPFIGHGRTIEEAIEDWSMGVKKRTEMMNREADQMAMRANPESVLQYIGRIMGVAVKENPEGVTHGDAKAVLAIQHEIAQEQARYSEDVYKLNVAFQRDKAMLDREHAERLLVLRGRLLRALPQPPTPAE